ncbi:PhoPQ-activated pathogenicity-related family protein [Adhaeretor mobilis]|uniref:PhoPQ-activated pathogenicity-related family protein n=1 Tax=Adhaeretor mobilis TaxID=1930276 RepID=UPI001C54F77E|nr:PhoPQ-activated protein PqaA family protein [Adhaeretor mobilis]
MAEDSTATFDSQVVEQVSSPLRDYLLKEDLSYTWEKVREGKIAGVEYVELILTSQTWRDIVWKHRLFILNPGKVAKSTNALLVIAGGRWKEEFADPSYDSAPGKEALLFAAFARQLNSPVAVLLQVPQQPIFDGMVEDEIISFTFEQFLDTREPEWPLLLPMVKSAVRGMDAIQAFCEEEWSLSIETFTVTGGSKRGWTTWLTGATDPRVTAIAPMVIDMLNMRSQLKHQQATWGEFSPMIHDYTQRKIFERIESSEGKELLTIVDPLAYKDSLKIPKLIVLGTNDPYWTLDSLNLYWPELLGPKHILYVPNNGHGLKDMPRVLGGVLALHEQTSGGDELPDLSWSFREKGDKVVLSIKSDIPPVKCHLWTAESISRDFRESRWTASEVLPFEDGYTIEIDKSKTGSKALFGEVVYDRKIMPLYLSTNVHITHSTKPAQQHE